VTDASPHRVRVLWLIKGLGPGGAERLLVASAAAIDRDAFDVEVAYLLPRKAQLVGPLEALGVPCTGLGMANEADLRWTWALRRLLRSRRFDIVHLHSPYAAAFARPVVRSLARRERPRLVTTEHNPWFRYKRATRLANALTAPWDDAVIAVSDETRGSFPNRRRRRAETIVHGVPLDDIRAGASDRAAVRRELGVADDALLVGTVANYHPKKDWPNLLHAARRIADADPSVRFCFVGQGPLEADVHELHERLGLQERVILTGHRADAVRVMSAFDVFVLASQWEGLPVALMEACALGLPIVATAVGGVAEHFHDDVDALLVPSQRADLLAAAVLRVAGDSALRARLAAASTRHAEEFDVRHATAQLERIYRSVLGTPAPG
jgi:glycosyltransferase involved in cell wall biosynthesis